MALIKGKIMLILLITMLFLAGCTSQIEIQKIGDQDESDALNNCFSKIDVTPGESYIQYQKDICRLNIVKESKNKGLCSEIKNENKKKECYDYIDELKFKEGTATKEDILGKCKCKNCMGLEEYHMECIYENVKTPQHCLGMVGIYLGKDFYGEYKDYFEEEELNKCLGSLLDRQNDTSFCEKYSDIYSAVIGAEEEEKIKNGFFKVSKVIDGETIELKNGKIVRLIGVDSPEEGKPYYEEAKNRLGEILKYGVKCEGYGYVQLEKENGYGDKDKYGRLLRYVYGGGDYKCENSEGGLVNAVMACEGLAKFYPYDYNVAHGSGLMREIEIREDWAINKKRGIWQDTKTEKLKSKNVTEEIDYIVCGGNLYDCDNFKTQEEAQIIFDNCIEHGDGDIHKLDDDKDGVACENLP